MYNNSFPVRLVDSLLERYKDSINSIEDGESLEEKRSCLLSVCLENKYHITNLKNQHCVLYTVLMLYKTVLTQKPATSDENYLPANL